MGIKSLSGLGSLRRSCRASSLEGRIHGPLTLVYSNKHVLNTFKAAFTHSTCCRKNGPDSEQKQREDKHSEGPVKAGDVSRCSDGTDPHRTGRKHSEFSFSAK